jgi:hypothetical protein
MAEENQTKKVTLEELVVSTLAMCDALSKLISPKESSLTKSSELN